MGKTIYVIAALLAIASAACGGRPLQSRCEVRVHTPGDRYTEVRLLDTRGNVLDSTLRVAGGTVTFTRTDSLDMPYVATLRLRNPGDSLDILYMPVVIEGGTVEVDLTDRISLSGTADNDRLYDFLRARNNFTARYGREGNPEHDVEKMRRDYSVFFADQILLHRGTVVGDYLLETYRRILGPEDLLRVMKEYDNKKETE